jgi:A/G-specific adenine glycosylase
MIDRPGVLKPQATRHPLRNIRAFRNGLLRWFERNGADHPWRRTRDPYAILVSEIMLQQTTVGAVLQNQRYEKFLAAYPDLPALAGADERGLLRAWEGLGYYNRVRNLQRAARAILENHGGRVPSDPATLRELPGVGPYVAGAVASFAFNQPAPAVDANIARVLSRLFDHRDPIDNSAGQKSLWEWAATLVPPGKARAFNSALMELGQTHCRASSPDCPNCPSQDFCQARRPEALPVKKPRRATVHVVEHVLFVRKRNGAVLLAREDGSQRRGLWKLPERPPESVADLPLLATRRYGITHHRVTMHIHECPLARVPPSPEVACERFHAAGELADLPMPSPYRRALEALPPGPS